MKSPTQQYIDKDLRYGAGNYAPLPVVLARGEGVFVWDVEGKRYFDMLSAYSALNQGHNHPRIVAAAKAQLDRLCLTSRAFHNDVMGDFLRKISELTGMEKVLPMNTGAEGVETAIKAMRRWGYEVKGVEAGKAEIIVCRDNFHGRTTTIVGFSTDPDAYEGYGPPTPGFKIIPYDDPAALEEAIGPNTCGFLVEPVQGEAGVIVPRADYLNRVREICDRRGILLCADEIQTGFGRTGRMFCFEHNGIRPDIMIMGKALSGGLYPISAIACAESIMKVFRPGTHGSTYGGNPLASAIGSAALDVLVEERLPEKAARLGDYFLSRLNAIEHPKIKARRGKGLLMAIEFTEPLAKEFCKKLLALGVLAKDTHHVTVRFAPALVITQPQIDETVEIVRSALAQLS
ncbi:MAG: ornithine--oxo-acid transaminase [Elusimicrobia bacterium]|nr:ornithine--oxo-acid transaminase [Elusimicrobiota bacterium]